MAWPSASSPSSFDDREGNEGEAVSWEGRVHPQHLHLYHLPRLRRWTQVAARMLSTWCSYASTGALPHDRMPYKGAASARTSHGSPTVILLALLMRSPQLLGLNALPSRSGHLGSSIASSSSWLGPLHGHSHILREVGNVSKK